MYRGHVFRFAVVAVLSLAAVVVSTQVAAAQQMMQPRTSQTFSGVKVNGGTVTQTSVNGRIVLTLSDDFKVPDSPDPHWQVVDSQGNVYALDRLQAKNGKFNKSITLPSYIHDVAKVQIWCAFAETLLGEAPFSSSMS